MNKLKKIKLYVVLLVIVLGVLVPCTTTLAYTEEEKAAAKAWLAGNGYSPDANGAAQAYADYMNGKFGKIEGLPDPVSTSQGQEVMEQEKKEEERRRAEREKAEQEAREKKEEDKMPSNPQKDGKNEGADKAADSTANTNEEKPTENADADSSITYGQDTDNAGITQTELTDAFEENQNNTLKAGNTGSEKNDEINSEINNKINNEISHDTVDKNKIAFEQIKDGESEDAIDFLSDEAMERIILLEAATKEADQAKSEGREYGITEKDRKTAMLLAVVAFVILIGGITVMVIGSKKKRMH